MLKDHNCAELNSNNIDQTVKLAGWVHRRRDHGQLIFIDLRDREGLVQIVFNPEVAKSIHQIASELRNEFVISISGKVARRPSGTENPKISTGEIEIIADQLKILNPSKTPPFYVNEESDVDENVRLKYRYLDLRRERMKQNIILRYKVVKFIREFLDKRDFIEIETPILTKSTPEGARDYLVPSRLNPGEFYALPQSPQQIKQLLMVAGFEKYYQIAKCFRDEDMRADRQPEFTQLDLEMSFVEEEDVLSLLEDMFLSLVESVKPEMSVQTKPIPRISFAECMELYGTDKPDTRFGLLIKDVTDIAGKSDFGVFRSAVEANGKVKGICIPGCADYSRKELARLTDLAKSLGAKGLVTISLEEAPDGQIAIASKSAVAKFLSPAEVQQLAARMEAKSGDLLLLVADQSAVVNKVLGEFRREMGSRLDMIDPNELAFLFVVNFPLLEWKEEENRWDSTHHPFTAPREEDEHLLDTDPAKVRARHYDIVCNGHELSSGSIRIHTRDLQQKIFRLLGHKDEAIEEQFGHMLEAFDYGAPPHGGIAPGIDRLVMILAQEQNIREVIPFPKNQNARDPLFDAPSPVSKDQLRDLHLSLSRPTEKKS